MAGAATGIVAARLLGPATVASSFIDRIQIWNNQFPSSYSYVLSALIIIFKVFFFFFNFFIIWKN